MKQVLITEEQLHEIVGRANAEVLANAREKEGGPDVMLTAHVVFVMNTVCNNLFNKEKKDV